MANIEPAADTRRFKYCMYRPGGEALPVKLGRRAALARVELSSVRPKLWLSYGCYARALVSFSIGDVRTWKLRVGGRLYRYYLCHCGRLYRGDVEDDPHADYDTELVD